MLPDTTNKLPVAGIINLIEEARNAELCRDIDLMSNILSEVWTDIEKTPDFSNYGEILNAELLRLYGVFLSLYGNARGLKNYQTRGKDLLTAAIEGFSKNNLFDKAAEAHVMLAFCYWKAGEISECEAILDLVEMDFGKNPMHPVYLQICINRMLVCFWKGDKENNAKAIKIIEEIEPLMRFQPDARLQAMFHNQAGIFYTNTKEFEKGVFHLNEAIRFAETANNKFYVAVNLNNLAFLYKDTKDFEKALGAVSKSIDAVSRMRHKGFLPHALDTKALIYLDWYQPEKALATSELSIKYFYEGEDFRGLTDALWTKTRCLLRLGQTRKALFCFGKLQHIAIEKIGEIAANRFADLLAGEIYALKNLPLTDEVSEFKKSRVALALIESDGSIIKATRLLRLKNHQALSEILNKQFPGLLEELGFKRRRRRGSSQRADGSRTVTLNSKDIHSERELARLVMPDKNFTFAFNFPSKNFETFYFDKYLMQKFGVSSGAVVAVAHITEFRKGMPVVAVVNDKFKVGETDYDSILGIYFISGDDGHPIPLDETNVIGEPVGYCDFNEADNTYIEFSRLEK